MGHNKVAGPEEAKVAGPEAKAAGRRPKRPGWVAARPPKRPGRPANLEALFTPMVITPMG